MFERMAMGWDIAVTSLQVIRDNRQLLFIPVLSIAALALVGASFFLGAWFFVPSIKNLSTNSPAFYISGFLYYLINYFVIVFFNVVLVYCSTMALLDKPFSVKTGFKVARSRLSQILAWSVVGASVGSALNALQESNHIGSIVASILGVIWSVITFFIIPILIYENRSVFDAVKASADTMRRTWGESLGAQFSFGLLYIVGLIPIALLAWLAFSVNQWMGIFVLVGLFGFLMTLVSTANSIFVAAIYMQTRGKNNSYFRGRYAESAFVTSN